MSEDISLLSDRGSPDSAGGTAVVLTTEWLVGQATFEIQERETGLLQALSVMVLAWFLHMVAICGGRVTGGTKSVQLSKLSWKSRTTHPCVCLNLLSFSLWQGENLTWVPKKCYKNHDFCSFFLYLINPRWFSQSWFCTSPFSYHRGEGVLVLCEQCQLLEFKQNSRWERAALPSDPPGGSERVGGAQHIWGRKKPVYMEGKKEQSGEVTGDKTETDEIDGGQIM